MSVSLTSSGYGIDSYRKLGVVYFNGSGTVGTNYPIGSVISLIVQNSTVSLTGKWSGLEMSQNFARIINGSIMYTSVSAVDSLTSLSHTGDLSGTNYLIQRIS